MRIVQLTAGTGSFYCGTCIRDNALVVELRRQGQDALLVPMYLAPMLDDPGALSASPRFFGGINVYLQQKLGLFRATPRWLDRLLDAPSLLRAAAGRAGMTSARELGEITLSMLQGEQGRQLKELQRLAAWLAAEPPQVLCLSNLLLLGLARRLREHTGAAIICFLNGEDAFLDSLPSPYREQCWEECAARAGDVDRFLGVSGYYTRAMEQRLRLAPGHAQTLYPGILLEGYSARDRGPRPRALGYLARMIPGKGLFTLVEAYLALRRDGGYPDLKLRIAGSCTAADERHVREVRRRVAAAGLERELEVLPNLSREEKLSFLSSLTVFSVPATYGESFGLYLLEAMAAGVPVVQPRHAAFPELIEATGGGLLCEPDDPHSLAGAVRRVLDDEGLARQLGAAGRAAVYRGFSVERMATEALRHFSEVAPGAPAMAGQR
jgi:glycosyltransferase involved in cell wall biosynthesis